MSVVAPTVAEYHPEARNRVYPPETVVMIMINAVLSREESLRSSIVRNNIDRMQNDLEPASLSTAALSEARSRLRMEVMSEATRGFAVKFAGLVKVDPVWMGMNPFVIDGSTLTANDTPENQAALPQLTTQKPGLGFPILRVVILQSLATGMVQDLSYAPYEGKGTGEMALSREVIPSIPDNAVLLGDRYFPSFFTLAELIRRGIHGIFPAHVARGVDFRRGTQNGKRDHCVSWQRPVRPEWMSEAEYRQYPEEINVRELDVFDKKGDKGRLILVTTLTDASKYSKAQIAKMYRHRWKIEVALRDLKATFGLDHINANSPEMVAKSLWAHALAYNTLRWHILNASVLYEVDKEHVSIKGAADILIQNIPIIASTTPEGIPKLFASLYFQVIQVPVGKRPGRSEPRAVKRRPKPRKLLMVPRRSPSATNASH